MRVRKPLLVAAVPAALLVVAWVALFPLVPAIDPPTADRLSAAADRWCEQSADRVVPPDEWPEEVRQLRPQYVWVTQDGVYIERGSFFVGSWGVFVLRTGSSLQPGRGTDPSYRALCSRVYWYEIKG